ncbi:ABC transporter permease [Devosia sp. A369]
MRQQLRSLLEHKLGRVGLVISSLVLAVAILAPWIAPYDPAAIDWNAVLSPPSAQYWFGTDEIGRDIFSRILWGARVSVHIVVLSIVIAMVIGSVIGLVASYVGGWVDGLLMRIMDGLLAFPMLVLALGIIAILGPDLNNAVIAIALVNVPSFARLVRGVGLTIRNQDYIAAATSYGAAPLRIMLRHFLPNASGQIIVFASLKASTALITESALSFLGLGVQPPTASWGTMMAIGLDYLSYWWMSIFPGLAIFITILGLNFLGDAVRDVMDPRLQGSRSD